MDMSNKSYDPGRTPQCLRVNLVSGLEWVICSNTASYEQQDVQPVAQPSVIVECCRTNAERSRVECDVGSPGELYLNDDSGLGYCPVNCDNGPDMVTVSSCDIGETWSSGSELPGDRVHNVIGNRTSSCLGVDMAPSLDTRMIMIRPVDEVLEIVTDMEPLSGSSVVTDQEIVGGSSVTVAYPECGIQVHGGILEDDDQQFGNTTQIDRVLPDACVPNLDPHTPSDDSWSVRGQYPEYHGDVLSEGQITFSKSESPREDRFTTESFTVEQRDPERSSLDGMRHFQEVETHEQDYGVNVVGDQLEAKGQISVQDTGVVVCDNCQTPPVSPLLFGKSNECVQDRDCYFTKPVQSTISLVPFLVWISGSRNKSVPPRMSGSSSPTQFRHGTSNNIPNGDNVFTINGCNPDWSPNGDRRSGVGSQQADLTVECEDAVTDDGRGDKCYENLFPDEERLLRKRKISKRLQSRLASRFGYLNFPDFIMDDDAALSYGDIDSLDWDDDDDDDDVFYLEVTKYHCIILDKNGKVVKSEQRKSAAQLDLCSRDAGEEDQLDWHPESVTDGRQLDSYQQNITDDNQLGSPEHSIKDDDSQLSTHEQNAMDDSQLDLPHQNITYDSHQVLYQQNNVVDSQLASHQQNVTASYTNVNPSDSQLGMCQENLTNDNQQDLCQQNVTYGSQLDLHQKHISSKNQLGLNREVITDDSQFDSYQEVIVDDSHPELCRRDTTDDTQVDCCQLEGSNDSQIHGGVNRVDVKDVGVKISGEVVCSADDITTSGADVLAPESFSGFIASRDQQLEPDSVVFCSPTGKHRSINPESPHNDEPGAVQHNTGSPVVDGQGVDSGVEGQSAAIKTISDPVSGATGAEASGERVSDDCQRSVTANKAGKLQWQNEHNDRGECYIEERACEECHTAGDSNESNSSSSSSLRSPSRVHADDTSHAGSVQELSDLLDGGRVSGVSLRDVGEVTSHQPVIGGSPSGDCSVQNLRFSVTQVRNMGGENSTQEVQPVEAAIAECNATSDSGTGDKILGAEESLGSNVDDEFCDVGGGEVEGSGHSSPELGSSDDDSDIEYLLASDEAPVTEEEFDRLLPADFHQAGVDVVPSGGTNSLGKLVVSGHDEVPTSEMAANEQPNIVDVRHADETTAVIAKLERTTDTESQHLDAPGVTYSDRGHSPCDLHSGTNGAEIGLPPATLVSSGSLLIIESRSIDGCSLVNISEAHTTQHPEDSNTTTTSVTEQVSGSGDCTAPLGLLQSVKNHSELISQKSDRGVNGSTRDLKVANREMGSDRTTSGAWNLQNGHMEESLGRLRNGGVKSGRDDKVARNVKISSNGGEERYVDVSNVTSLEQDVDDIDALVAGECCEVHDTDIDDLYRLAMADHQRSELINSGQEDELASIVHVNQAPSHTSYCGDNDAAAHVSRSAMVTAPSKLRNASELSSIDGDDATKLVMAKGHCETSKKNNKTGSKDTLFHDSAERCPDPSVSCLLKLKPDKKNGVEHSGDGAKMGELLDEKIHEQAGSDTTSVEQQEGDENNGLKNIDVACKMLKVDVICDDKLVMDGTKMSSVGDCLKNAASPIRSRSGVIRANAVSVTLEGHLSHEVTSDIAALDLCDVFDSTASDSVSGRSVPSRDSLTDTTVGVTDYREPVVTEPTKNNVRVAEPIDRDPRGRDEDIEPLESNDGEVVVNGVTGNAEQAASGVQSISRGGCCSSSNEESGIMKTLCSDEGVENNAVRMDRAIDAAIEGDRSNGNSIGRGRVMSDGANGSCLEPGGFGKGFQITTNDDVNEGEEIDQVTLTLDPDTGDDNRTKSTQGDACDDDDDVVNGEAEVSVTTSITLHKETTPVDEVEVSFFAEVCSNDDDDDVETIAVDLSSAVVRDRDAGESLGLDAGSGLSDSNDHVESACKVGYGTHKDGTSTVGQSGISTQLPEAVTDIGCQAEFSDDSDYPYYYCSTSSSGGSGSSSSSGGGSSHENTPDRIQKPESHHETKTKDSSHTGNREQNGEHPVHSRRFSGSGQPVRLAALDMGVNRTDTLPESNFSVNEATFDLANGEANNKLSRNEAGSGVIPPKLKNGEQPSGLDPDLDWAGMINKAGPSGHLVDSFADGVPLKPGEYLPEKDPASQWELAGETKLGVGKFIPTADLASSSQPDSPTNSDRPQVGGDYEPRSDAGVVDCESAQLELSADQRYDTVRSSGHFSGTREGLAVDVHPDNSVNFALHSGSMGQEESKGSDPEGNVSGVGSVSSPDVGANRREPTAQQKCETKRDNMAPIGNRRIKDGNSLPDESGSTAPTNCIAPERVPEGGNLSGTIDKEVACRNISSADGVPGQQSGSVSAAAGINQTDSSGNMDTDTATGGVSVSGTGTAINTPPPSVGSDPDGDDSDPDRKRNHSEVATAAITDSSLAGQFDIKSYPEMDRDGIDICSELKDVADPEFFSADHGLGGISSDQREDVAASAPDGDISLSHGAGDPEIFPVDQDAALDPVGTPQDQLDMIIKKAAGGDTTQEEVPELTEGQVLDNADDQVTPEQVVGPITPGSSSGEHDSGVSHPEADSLISVNEHSAGSIDGVVQSPGVVSHPDGQPSDVYSRSDDDDDDDDDNKQCRKLPLRGVVTAMPGGVTGDVDGVLSHEVLQRASRHDGGECLYLPNHTSLTSSGTQGMAESALWSPDSGIDELTESDAMFSDVEDQKEGLATLEDPEQVALPSTDVSFHSAELPNHPGVVCDESARTPPTSGFENSSHALVRTNDHALIGSNDPELELITAGTTKMGELAVQSNLAPNIPSDTDPVPSDPDNEVINAVVMAENKSLCVSMPDASGYAQDDSCHLENATDKALIGSSNRNEQLLPSALANITKLEPGAETSRIDPLQNLEGDISIDVDDPDSVSKMVDVVQKWPQPTDKVDELPQSNGSEGVDPVVGDYNDGGSDRKMAMSSSRRKKVKSKVDKGTSSEGFTIIAAFGKRKKSNLNVGMVCSGTQAPDCVDHGTGSWRDELIETSVGGGEGGGWVAPSSGGDDEESEFDVGGEVRNGDRKTSGCFNVGQVVGEHVQIGTFSAAMAEMFERDVQAICDEIERNKVEAVIPEYGLRGSRRSSSGSQILDNVQIELGQVTPEQKPEKRAELGSDPVASLKAESRSGKGIGDVESLSVEAKLIFGEVKEARLMAAVWEAERNILDMFGVKLPKVTPANDIKSPAKKIDNSIEEKENWLEPEHHQLSLMKDTTFGLSDGRVPETVPSDQGAAEQTHESSETAGIEPTTLQNESTEIPRLEPRTLEAESTETAGLEPSAVQAESAETAGLEPTTVRVGTPEPSGLEPSTDQAESAALAGLEPSLEQADSAETCLSEPSSEKIDSGETVKLGLVKTEPESVKILKPVLAAVESETAASHRLEPSATGLESQGTTEMENTTFEPANKHPESVGTAYTKPDTVCTKSTGTIEEEPDTLQSGSSGTEELASGELESTKPRTGAVLSESSENPILASKSAEPNLMGPPEISSGTAQPESAGTAEPSPHPASKLVTGKKMADDRRTLSSDKKGYKKPSLLLKKKTKSADLKDVDVVIFAPPPPNAREAKKELNAIDLLQEMNASEEQFKDAREMVFSDPADLDMLDKLGNKNNNLEASTLTRQSLYVKFDPLVKGQNLDKNKNPRSPKKSAIDGVDLDENLMLMSSPHPDNQGLQPPGRPVTKEAKDNAHDVDKIWSFDHQDMDGVDSSQEQSMNCPTNKKSNFPDPAESAVLKYSQIDWDRKEKEMELNFQANLLSKERERQKERENDQNKIRSLAANLKGAEKTIKHYDFTLGKVIESHEKKVAQLMQVIDEVESKNSKAESDLNTIESAFADFHQRYEQLRLTVEGFKKNEALWQTEIDDYIQKLDKQEHKYQLLKKHVEGKLEEANQKVEKVSKMGQNEITWLKAALKRTEITVNSLEQQLEQKAKENKELTSICDDLLRAQDSAK